MHLYLAQQAQEAAEPSRSPIVLAFAALQKHFQLFPGSSPVFWVTIFWCLDWILGSWLAIRRRNWSPKRATYSIAKWLLWMFALAVAWGFRDANFLGASYLAAVMEAAIIMAEGSSVLRNAAELSDNKLAKRLLGVFATAIEGRVDELEHKIETVQEATQATETRVENLEKKEGA